MKVGKWNYNTKKYDEYELPEKATTYSDYFGCNNSMILFNGGSL